MRHCSGKSIKACNGGKLKDCLSREADREISKINRPCSSRWKEKLPLQFASISGKSVREGEPESSCRNKVHGKTCVERGNNAADCRGGVVLPGIRRRRLKGEKQG